MKYITNINEQPMELPSTIGATYIGNPTAETILELGFIPVIEEVFPEQEEWKKAVWERNQLGNDWVIAIYANVDLTKEESIKIQIDEENKRYREALATGFDTGLGFNIPMDEDSRDVFKDIYNGIVIAGLAEEETFDYLRDIEWAKHTVTIGELFKIAKGYAMACIYEDGLNAKKIDELKSLLQTAECSI